MQFQALVLIKAECGERLDAKNQGGLPARIVSDAYSMKP